MIAIRIKAHIQKSKAQLNRKFDTKDLREAKKILGIEITRDRDSRRTVAISGELHSQDVGKIQHDKSKTGHHSFGRSLQVILQEVSIITRR